MREIRDWSKQELIGIASAHDRAAQKDERERYSRHRKIAFSARRYARQKNY